MGKSNTDRYMMGQAVHLYLTENGNLLVTDNKRTDPGLRYLSKSADFEITAPLQGAVIAKVSIIVSSIEIEIPKEQVIFKAIDPAPDSDTGEADLTSRDDKGWIRTKKADA